MERANPAEAGRHGRLGPKTMNNFETFEHEADIGIRGFGATLEEAFAQAAVALYSVMVDVSAIEPKEEKQIAVSAPDREMLLVEWLNALLSLSDIERMVFGSFELRIEQNALSGVARGEHLDRDRHAPHVEVKAATYHMLRVDREGDRYVAQCVVDV